MWIKNVYMLFSLKSAFYWKKKCNKYLWGAPSVNNFPKLPQISPKVTAEGNLARVPGWEKACSEFGNAEWGNGMFLVLIFGSLSETWAFWILVHCQMLPNLSNLRAHPYFLRLCSNDVTSKSFLCKLKVLWEWVWRLSSGHHTWWEVYISIASSNKGILNKGAQNVNFEACELLLSLHLLELLINYGMM